jgi:DNA-binding NarL/FixJ family response regulator
MDRRRPRNPPLRPLVLLVEQHEETRALYALPLSASGFDVVAAQDGAEAYRCALEIHPDMIVVAMSSDVQRSRHERAEPGRFTAFFPKSCLPDELAAGLRQLLKPEPHAGIH